MNIELPSKNKKDMQDFVGNLSLSLLLRDLWEKSWQAHVMVFAKKA